MFRGSVPPQMRSFVRQTVLSWGIDELWVGCSGNFTLERGLPEFRHHGNDVTLYSSAIGWWAAGDPLPITLKEESAEELAWLEPHTHDRDDLLATLMLGTRFLASVGREDNVFHRRQVAAHRDQWPTLHAKTLERVRSSPLRLESYACKDVREWLVEDVPPDAAVLSFPPFFGGDYESMFQSLDDHFDWDEPTYEILDEEGKDHMLELVVDRQHWVLGLHQRRPEYEDHLRGVVQTTNRGVPIYLYASGGPKRVVTPAQATEPVLTSRLGPWDELTGEERITFSVLTAGQFATLRSQYMNHGIKPGTPLMALAVKADDRIVGCLAFSTPDHDPHLAYLLSDFPVAPVKYLRLSALMVRLAQSAEVKHLLQRSLNRRINGVRTTAFTDNPVSMKYRTGGMTLEKRTDSDDGVHQYMLNYRSDAGRWTADEAYRAWHGKHARRQRSRP